MGLAKGYRFVRCCGCHLHSTVCLQVVKVQNFPLATVCDVAIYEDVFDIYEVEEEWIPRCEIVFIPCVALYVVLYSLHV